MHEIFNLIKTPQRCAYNIRMRENPKTRPAATVKKAKEAEWLEQSRGAIEAYNARIEKEGLLLEAFWIKDMSTT